MSCPTQMFITLSLSIYSSTLYMSYVEKSLLPTFRLHNFKFIWNYLNVIKEKIKWDQAKIQNDLCLYGNLSGLNNTAIPFTSFGGSKPWKYIWLFICLISTGYTKIFPQSQQPVQCTYLWGNQGSLYNPFLSYANNSSTSFLKLFSYLDKS